MKLRRRELILAFLFAVTAWYGIRGGEKLEAQIPLRVGYRGIPENLVVVEGMLSEVTVRIRASSGIMRALKEKGYAYTIDLAGLRKGDDNLFAITLPPDFFGDAVEVLSVTPAHVMLDVDQMQVKNLPLEVDVQGDLPKDVVVQATAAPSEVAVRGPATALAKMTSVRLPVPVGNATALGGAEILRSVSLPESMTATPSEVKVFMHVGIKRKQVNVARKVIIPAPRGRGVYARPDRVNITVAMPESLASKAAANPDISAHAALPGGGLGAYNLPVRVHLPEGAELIKVEPDHISVTVEQE